LVDRLITRTRDVRSNVDLAAREVYVAVTKPKDAINGEAKYVYSREEPVLSYVTVGRFGL
jgi:hypothetical protein